MEKEKKAGTSHAEDAHAGAGNSPGKNAGGSEVDSAEKDGELAGKADAAEGRSDAGMPVFDPEGILGMSAEQLDEYGRQYTAAVEKFVREQAVRDLDGLITDIEAREREQEWRDAENELGANADYYDFAEKREQVRRVCDALESAENANPRTRMTMAYLMVKGAQALGEHKNPAVRTPEEIAEEVWSNSDVMKLLAERRAKQADSELPVFARASAGAASSPQSPKTLADASAQARKYFEI